MEEEKKDWDTGYMEEVRTSEDGNVVFLHATTRSQEMGEGWRVGEGVRDSGQVVPLHLSGLEQLIMVDDLFIQQKVDIAKEMFRLSTANQYNVKTSNGSQLFFVMEESGECDRCCLCSERGLVLHITDNLNQEVIRVRKGCKCMTGCCWCACCDCSQASVLIEAPPGVFVGSVRQRYRCCEVILDVYDSSDTEIFNISCPLFSSQCCCSPDDINFKILATDGRKVGAISKQWSGLTKECCSDAANFGLNFPLDLDVRMKAVLLGAVFQIDFLFYKYAG